MIPGTAGGAPRMTGERRRDGVRPERRKEKQKKNSQYKTDAGGASVFVWDHLLIVFFSLGASVSGAAASAGEASVFGAVSVMTAGSAAGVS